MSIVVFKILFPQDTAQGGEAGGLAGGGGGQAGEILGELGFVRGAVEVQPLLILDGVAQKAVAVGKTGGDGHAETIS